jgi:hypothetical protein
MPRSGMPARVIRREQVHAILIAALETLAAKRAS